MNKIIVSMFALALSLSFALTGSAAHAQTYYSNNSNYSNNYSGYSNYSGGYYQNGYYYYYPQSQYYTQYPSQYYYYPTYPSYPQYPSYPSYPSYPTYPTYPTQQTLNVTCSPSTYSTNVNGYVTWTASATGGSSSQYFFTWSGEGINTATPAIQNNSLSYSGGSNYVSAYYTTAGQKTASVTVTSGGQTQTRQCGTVQVNGYQYPTYPYGNQYGNGGYYGSGGYYY